MSLPGLLPDLSDTFSLPNIVHCPPPLPEMAVNGRFVSLVWPPVGNPNLQRMHKSLWKNGEFISEQVANMGGKFISDVMPVIDRLVSNGFDRSYCFFAPPNYEWNISDVKWRVTNSTRAIYSHREKRACLKVIKGETPCLRLYKSTAHKRKRLTNAESAISPETKRRLTVVQGATAPVETATATAVPATNASVEQISLNEIKESLKLINALTELKKQFQRF